MHMEKQHSYSLSFLPPHAFIYYSINHLITKIYNAWVDGSEKKKKVYSQKL